MCAAAPVGKGPMGCRMSTGRQRGFTYLMLLWWVAISGVMLAALGHRWSTEMRRQRETDLVFRGQQIKQALLSYQRQPVEAGPTLPVSLDELLEDHRGPKVVRHLRQVWADPVTGKPWGLVLAGDRIAGVYSTSNGVPLAAPEGVERYDEWKFTVPVDVPSTETVNKPSS